MKNIYIRPIMHEINGLLQSIVLTGSNQGIQEYIPIGNGGGKEPGAKQSFFDIDDADGNEDSGITEW